MEVRKIAKKTVTVIVPKRSFLVDKERHRQKRVAAYCRVSTDSEEQLTSYTNQKRVYTEMIASNPDWELVGIYADEGISGTRADKRKDFQRMINDCYHGKIDYIITKSVSRFARNTIECLEYVRKLKAMGIGIYFEEQNIDTLKSDSELYLVIFAGFAQSESESISKNVTWSFRKNFEEGKATFIYGRWLGYRKGEDGEPEIVPHEAKIVEEVFERFLAGETPQSIADTLQARNIEIPGKSFKFTKQMIRNLLQNERYCGDCILQKTVTVDPIAKKRKKNEGEAPMYIVENNHTPIISRETFNRVQEELSRRKIITPKSHKTSITSTGRYSKYALTEVLKCGECGSRYRRVTWSKNGKTKIVWRCINRLDYGQKYCKESITVEESTLHKAIVRALKKFNDEDEATYLALMKATIGDAIGINGGSEEIDLLERRIEAQNKRMLALVNESVSKGEDMESREQEFKEIADTIEQLKRRINAIRESQSNNSSTETRMMEIHSIMNEYLTNMDQYDDRIVRQMVECIRVYHDGKLEIVFGGGAEIIEYIV